MTIVPVCFLDCPLCHGRHDSSPLECPTWQTLKADPGSTWNIRLAGAALWDYADQLTEIINPDQWPRLMALREARDRETELAETRAREWQAARAGYVAGVVQHRASFEELLERERVRSRERERERQAEQARHEAEAAYRDRLLPPEVRQPAVTLVDIRRQLRDQPLELLTGGPPGGEYHLVIDVDLDALEVELELPTPWYWRRNG